MRLRDLVLFLILFLAFAVLLARARPGNHNPPPPTPVASGEEMYVTYCAECHGLDGKGALYLSKGQTPATNLTTLAKKNGGRFPYGLVRDSIRGDTHSRVFGAEGMPPWGILFQYVGGGDRLEVEARINKLTDYLRTLQQK
jgi:mono/diheme cytochrome c family protein